VFSDVICYPERLLRLVQQMLDRPRPPSVVATIKFQGQVEPTVTRAFAAIPGARVLHLSRNRHELTFVRLANSR